MAIRTGIGVGAAQIADTSNIMNAYGRQIAQQQKAQALQAEREAKAAAKYEEDLADLIANVKTDGARDVDVPDITNAYNDIKEYYSQSGSLKDKDKPLFRAELMNRVKNLNEFAQRSNKLSKDYGSVLEDMAKNEWDYEPSSVNEIRTIAQTPLKKLGANSVIDPLRYKRQADPTLIIKALDDVYNLGEKNSTPSGQFVDKSGLKYSVKKVSPAFINNALVQKIQNDPQALQSLSVLYRRTTGDNNPTTEKLTGFLKDQYETRYKYDYLGNAMQPRVGRSDGGGSSSEEVYNQPIELNLPFAEGKGFVNVKDYVKLPLAGQNFAGSRYIDMATGGPSTEALESSNDYEVVGVGNFPIITRGNMKGSLSQPRFAEQNPNAVKLTPMVHVQKKTGSIIENLLVPYDRLPPSTKTKKGLANFTPAGSGTKSAPTKTFNVDKFLKEKGITK